MQQLCDFYDDFCDDSSHVEAPLQINYNEQNFKEDLRFRLSRFLLSFRRFSELGRRSSFQVPKQKDRNQDKELLLPGKSKKRKKTRPQNNFIDSFRLYRGLNMIVSYMIGSGFIR